MMLSTTSLTFGRNTPAFRLTQNAIFTLFSLIYFSTGAWRLLYLSSDTEARWLFLGTVCVWIRQGWPVPCTGTGPCLELHNDTLHLTDAFSRDYNLWHAYMYWHKCDAAVIAVLISAWLAYLPCAIICQWGQLQRETGPTTMNKGHGGHWTWI